MNLLILKNKKIIICIVLLIAGLIVTTRQENAPEGKRLSSGDSVIWGNMTEIDNYESIRKYLNKRHFSFWDEIEVLKEDEEYPQGLCITDECVFISSYSAIRGKLGYIRAYDRASGEYLISFGMDASSHLGGLAFDGENLWVCNPAKMAIERISYAFILQMIEENKGQTIDIRNLVDRYHVSNIPSTVAYYDGALWVATHSVLTNATMVRYSYSQMNDKLEFEEVFWIPSKVQGIAFKENGEVYLSTSYGRTISSRIKRYNSVYDMSENVEAYTEEVKLPPCSEGIVYQDKKLYIIFESAGKKYLEGTDGKGKSKSPIDKILVLNET